MVDFPTPPLPEAATAMMRSTPGTFPPPFWVCLFGFQIRRGGVIYYVLSSRSRRLNTPADSFSFGFRFRGMNGSGPSTSITKRTASSSTVSSNQPPPRRYQRRYAFDRLNNPLPAYRSAALAGHTTSKPSCFEGFTRRVARFSHVSSIACWDVTPTCLRNLRIDIRVLAHGLTPENIDVATPPTPTLICNLMHTLERLNVEKLALLRTMIATPALAQDKVLFTLQTPDVLTGDRVHHTCCRGFR
jgi:hypothetical protein